MDSIVKLKQYSSIKRVLLVEDDDTLRETTAELLATVFDNVDRAENGLVGLDIYNKKRHDIVITDIIMPEMNGIEMIAEIKKNNPKQHVIVISGHNDTDALIELINNGVDNFILKPFKKENLFNILDKIIRYKWLSQLERDYQSQLENAVMIKTQELSKTLSLVQELSDEIVLRLSTAAEFKDTETGAHIKRLGILAQRLAMELEETPEFIDAIVFAAPLHDVGKIGIPDNILLKPGKLTSEEFEIMKTHTIIGSRILSDSHYFKIQMAQAIALYHHEKYDGTGYPEGLKGEEIPLEGRIITICDQYDALRSDRPYKKGFTHEDTCDILINGDGRTKPEHFDPKVLGAFIKVKDEFKDIFEDHL